MDADLRIAELAARHLAVAPVAVEVAEGVEHDTDAVELARHGVTANAILPGWIKSDMTAGIMANDKFVANVMPRIPVRRWGDIPSDAPAATAVEIPR